jgi:hypothetical protein
MKPIYYFTFEFNKYNKTIESVFPDLTEGCISPDIILGMSKNFAEYQDSVQSAINTINSILEKIKNKSPSTKYKIYWEKQEFSGLNDTIDKEDDIIDNYWLINEAAKIHVLDIEEEKIHKQWMIKSRVFFKDSRIIHEVPLLKQ